MLAVSIEPVSEDPNGLLTVCDRPELWQDDIRTRMAARSASYRKQAREPVRRDPKIRLVPLQAQDPRGGRAVDKNASFGQRRSQFSSGKGKGKERARDAANADVRRTADGGVEMTFIPRTTASGEDYDDEEKPQKAGKGKGKEPRRKGVEVFGAGMEKGGEEPEVAMSEAERRGRTKRRQGMRSGSKNTFRRM